ncbi:hypothetical protein MTO96_051193 [Rhipicephalus appendiculatus]
MERNDETSNPTGGGDTITARDLLQVLQEKDRLLSDPAGTIDSGRCGAASTSANVPGDSRLKPQHQSLRRLRRRSFSAEWIENIRRTSNLHGWPAAYTLETAKARLVGAAKDWYRSRSSHITSWEEFEVRFRRTFDLRQPDSRR